MNTKTSSHYQQSLQNRKIYLLHLDILRVDFTECFQDILNMNIPSWVLDPFANADTEELSNLEEELIELTTNELKVNFKHRYQAFRLQELIPVLYPGLWTTV